MAKVKIVHKVSKVSQMVTSAQAKGLKSNPRFARIYDFEETVQAPAEIRKPKPAKSEKPKASKEIPAQTPPKTGETIVG